MYPKEFLKFKLKMNDLNDSFLTNIKKIMVKLYLSDHFRKD